jgi:nucleoid-associated protein YgaU
MVYDESREKREFMRKRSLDDASPIPETRYIAQHTVASEETLSHIALKYYGHATKPYYMLVYDANKRVIGDDPNSVKPGLVLQIPELPDKLKDE